MSFAITGKEDIVIYGVGERGKEIAKLFCKNGFHIKAFLDQKAKEFESIKIQNDLIPIINPEQYVVDSCEEIAIISLWNAGCHEKVADFLYKIGFDKIIYIPLRMSGNRKLMSEMRIVFNDMLAGESLFDNIPSYLDLMTDPANNHIFFGGHLIYMPVENLFSQEKYSLALEELERIEYVKRKKWMETAGENLINYKAYYQLYQYLDRADGEYADYLSTQINDFEKVEEEKKRILRDRYELFQTFEKAFAINRDFFVDSAPAVEWNEKGYFNIMDGHHRAVYLLYKGVWDIPVRIRECDRRYVELWNHVPNTFWCESPYSINQENFLFRRKLNAIICSSMLKKDVAGKRIYINLDDAGLLGRYCCRLGCELCVDVESKEAAEFAQKICDMFQFTEHMRICTHIEYECGMDFAVIDEKCMKDSKKVWAHVYILKVEENGTLHNDIKRNMLSYVRLGKCFDGEKEYLVIKLNGENLRYVD